MNYLIVSTDKLTLDEKIKELNKNNDSEIVYYDLIDTSIDEVLEDLNTFNLFNTKKIITAIIIISTCIIQPPHLHYSIFLLLPRSINLLIL